MERIIEIKQFQEEIVASHRFLYKTIITDKIQVQETLDVSDESEEEVMPELEPDVVISVPIDPGELIDSGEQFTCPLCPNRTFNSKTDLGTHRRTVHEVKRFVNCDICGKPVKYMSLKIHKEIHLGNSEKVVLKCTQCPKEVFNKKLLQKHMRIYHGDEERLKFVCDICGKTFAFKGGLNRHMRIHTGERPYECQECNQTFRHNEVYITHMRRHRGIKPYKCEQCEKYFLTNSDRLVHQKSHADGYKPRRKRRKDTVEEGN